MTELLIEGQVKLSVSSVLDRNGKEYGKQFLLDGEEDTCWNSDQGLPQYIKAQLSEAVSGSAFKLRVQFQGGFCGKECSLIMKSASETLHTMDFWPEDSNDYQEFDVAIKNAVTVDNIQLTFKSTTDFYGRIIVYQLSFLLL